MAGLTTRIQLVSNALILLGGSPISSLTEESTGAVIGANLFENTYLAMLQNHRWRFAVKRQILSRLSAKPNTGYNYAYQLPSDFQYVVKGDATAYEIYNSEIHCNNETFTLDYVYRVEEDVLPAYFAKALEYNLAHIFAVPLTGDLNKADFYGKMFNSEMKKAKYADSSQFPEVSVMHNPYIDIRY